MADNRSLSTKSQKTYWLSFLIFTTLTILALVQGQISIFYIIYLFWWQELIRTIVNQIFNNQYNKLANEEDPSKNSSLPQKISLYFLLGIYLIFILVIFGFMANWNNSKIIIINIEVLLFRNWFFNLNIIYFLINHIAWRRAQKQVIPAPGAFSSNMIVLHISIILGALLMSFVVKNNPNYFNPENLWGSVIIISPFILLNFFVNQKFQK